jgi:DivIVA domain-containing protein
MKPADIPKKQFKTTRARQGYDPKEVDDFLDRVYGAWQGNLNRLEGKYDDNNTPTVATPPPPAPTYKPGPSVESITLLLAAAEQTAAQIEAKARANAADIEYAAQAKAAKATGEAAAKAQATTKAAEAKVRAANAQLRKIATERKAHIDALRKLIKEADDDFA